MTLALIGPLGMPELIIILLILVLLFGAKRLSGVGRGLGQSIRGFKEEMRNGADADRDDAGQPAASDEPRPNARRS
jgi:sec-independent protein translocase protein TatA